MRGKRKRYYHKTIILKDVFSNTLIYTIAVVFAVGIVVSVLGKLNIQPSRAFIMAEFDKIFCAGQELPFEKRNVYDRISAVIPSVKSSEEMTKKYSAKYSGVKKEDNAAEKQDKQEEISFSEGKKIKSIDMSSDGITFRNETAYTPDVQSLLNTKLTFKMEEGKPNVLIMHTHTSEAYAESPDARSTDNNKNVARVGTVIEERLKSQGINVIHDVTRNDYPAYNGSYTKALAGITSNLEKNPTIEVVLDVHRDYAEQTKNGEAIQLKPVATVEGKQVAQVMFVIGTDGLGLKHPDWKHNLAFAVQIQAELNKVSPKIARPVNIRRERFNQHMTKGSMIIEVGTAGNTIQECENAGYYIGNAIAEVLKRY